MQPIRVVAISKEIADAVRSTLQAPGYGFPAHKEVGEHAAPCRHCLRLIEPGLGGRILFTYDRFSGVESLPQPGPIYVHAEDCPRYAEDGGIPEELRGSPRTLERYAQGRRLVVRKNTYLTANSRPPSKSSLPMQKSTTCRYTARRRDVSPFALKGQPVPSSLPANAGVAHYAS